MAADLKEEKLFLLSLLDRTLGYTIGMIIGIDPHIGASLGLVSMFCCVVNCPVTSLALGIEMFGGLNFVPFAIVVAFGYVLSGYFSLYQAQKIVYSKTSPSFINKNVELRRLTLLINFL